MIEMSLKQYREEYKKLSFPADLKSAGLLVIPNNALFKVQISDAEKDAIIEKGANILRQLSPWLFFRSSWTEYFFLSQQSTNEVEAIIDDLIKHEASLEPIMDMWKKLVLPFDEGPEMFPEFIERISWELQKKMHVFEGLKANHENNAAMQQPEQKKPMPEEKPYISPPPEADGNYKYYCMGGFLPIRVIYDESWRALGTEAPSYETNGELGLAALLTRIMKGDDVEAVTKNEFVRLCHDFMSTKPKHLTTSFL